MDHITIVTAGSIGDVQPFVALGLGLKHIGYNVRIATNSRFEKFVRTRGLEFRTLRFDIHELGQAMLGRRRYTGQFNGPFFKAFRSMIEQGMLDCTKACVGTNTIITSFTGLPLSYQASEKFGIPLLQAYLTPITPTQAFPNPIFFSGNYFGASLNLLSYTITELIMWWLLRPFVNIARRNVLNLPPLSSKSPLRTLHEKQSIILYGFSDAFMSKPIDWSDWIHVTGYWHLDHEVKWQPQPELVNFLASGPTPIYVGFGSMNSNDPSKLTQLVLEALTITGQRAIIVTGRGGLKLESSSERVFWAISIPHDWLFPQVSLAIHHGGAGTVGASLRGGIPSIVVPFMTDQPFWGNQLFRMGVSVPPLELKRLTAKRLANAIDEVLDNTKLRSKATMMGEIISKENGIKRAVEVIHGKLTLLSNKQE